MIQHLIGCLSSDPAQTGKECKWEAADKLA